MKTKKLNLAAGLYFVANIKGVKTAGVVQKENKDFYLCQNSHAGSDCDFKYGFKHSWTIKSGSDFDLRSEGIQVTNLQLFKSKPKGFDLPSKISKKKAELLEFEKWKENIELAGYEVLFTRTGIKVGCTNIDAKKVLYVAEKMKKEMKRFMVADTKRKKENGKAKE